MKEIPESEIQAKFFADTGEKRGEILAKTFAAFGPLISSQSGRKKIHEKSSTFSTRDKTKFFHREILGVGGPKELCSLLWFVQAYNTFIWEFFSFILLERQGREDHQGYPKTLPYEEWYARSGPEGPERHLNATRQELPRDNFCHSISGTAQTQPQP